MWQSSCLYQPHPLLQSMINDRVKMMCFLFCVISLVVKQLQTSGEKQWSIVASHFSMLIRHTRRHTINHTQQKLNVHNKLLYQKLKVLRHFDCLLNLALSSPVLINWSQHDTLPG